jgi:putative nucleotidyltransferase with HDIG domain
MIRREEIEERLGPFLSRIESEEIREKVVEAWVLACRRGGWRSLSEVEEIPFTLLTPHRGVGFVEHTLAVTAGAIALAEAQSRHYAELPYPIDMDRLVAGGLLHDVGKLLEIEPDGLGGYRKSYAGKCARHPISGAILAAEVGLPQEIVNIIACHAKEGEGRPQVIETVFIHQADFATFNPLVMLQKGLLIL